MTTIPSRNDPRLPPRFWVKVSVDDASGCWIWTAATNSKGYGWFTHWRGRNQLAHRVAYEELIQPLPAYGTCDVQLDHLCRNRACVNPTHLEPVTARVNTLRGETVAANNAAKTTCARGHELSGSNVRRRRDGSRACRACTREDQRACKARRRHRDSEDLAA